MKTGFAFGEHIHTSRKRNRSQGQHASFSEIIQIRSYLFPIGIGIFSLILIVRLFFLQIVDGKYYQSLSDTNRIRTEIIHAPRGVIFDRYAKPLVFNVPGFRELKDSKIVLLSKEAVVTRLAKKDNNLEIDSLREYPYKDITSHILGYVGQISHEELSQSNSTYQGGDIIGKSGVEGEFESMLRGKDGKKLYEVDATGKRLRLLGQSDPIPGKDLTLTIDISLQRAAYDAMKDIKKGAVIVSNLQGEILALVSKPSYDANLFTLGASYKTSSQSAYTNIADILQDGQNQPIINRALSGTYPPGSTFKLIVASAALENKLIDQNYTIEDTGILHVGSFSFSNWYYTGYGKTDGIVNVVKAIKRSNDIFFYKIGQLVGVEKISAMAHKFNIGEATGIDLPGEARGLVPTKKWKQKVMHEPWYLGDDYHYGIGQGYLLVTPLQVNMWTQIIANNGSLYQPHVLKNAQLHVLGKDIVNNKTLELLDEGMRESCSAGGAAWPLFGYKVKNNKLSLDGKNFFKEQQSTTSADLQNYTRVSIACKTGTAQHGSESTNPHAWITLFAPSYKPQIVITVLAEESGQGSDIAAPIAKKILDFWFEK